MNKKKTARIENREERHINPSDVLKAWGIMGKEDEETMDKRVPEFKKSNAEFCQMERQRNYMVSDKEYEVLDKVITKNVIALYDLGYSDCEAFWSCYWCFKKGMRFAVDVGLHAVADDKLQTRLRID